MNKIILLSTLMALLLVGFQSVVEAPIISNAEEIDNILETTTKEEVLLQLQIQEEQLQEEQSEEKKYYNVPLSEGIQEIIFEYCELYDISIPLVLALIEQETGGTFNPELIHKNKNGTKDYGLMQLNSSNHKWFAELISEPNFDPLNVRHNIHAGIKYLSILKNQFKDKYSGEELKAWILNSYNMGVTGFKKYVKQTGSISRGYSNNILKNTKKYKEDGR